MTDLGDAPAGNAARSHTRGAPAAPHLRFRDLRFRDLRSCALPHRALPDGVPCASQGRPGAPAVAVGRGRWILRTAAIALSALVLATAVVAVSTSI